MPSPAFLGIDIGTTGIRASIIDQNRVEILSERIGFEASATVGGKNEQSAESWSKYLDQLLSRIPGRLKKLTPASIRAIAIDGTSSSLLAARRNGSALSPALMYNDVQSLQQAQTIKQTAPSDSAVHGASSSLAKALNLLQRHPDTEVFCHQADWLASQLTGSYGISDENNCLKLGYDSSTQQWPPWLAELLPDSLLPRVVAPGTVIGTVRPELMYKYGLENRCLVIAGTTDSNAAVLATGANQIGDAVTSLGSTLVLKLFTDRPIFDAGSGIYSHRINNHWLVGGASNSGGAALLQHFSRQQLDVMTPQLKPEHCTGLRYYPLPATGERFPVNDSAKQNMTEPRPGSDVEFFQGLLESIAHIEADGYKQFEALGAAPVTAIVTTGGGSSNPAWNAIREKITGVKVTTAEKSEASYGSALLAMQGYNDAQENHAIIR